MRTPLEIPDYLVKEAQLYAPSRDALDAVCYVLQDYPRLVSESRKMRSRLADIDREAADLDSRIDALVAACESILELSR